MTDEPRPEAPVAPLFETVAQHLRRLGLDAFALPDGGGGLPVVRVSAGGGPEHWLWGTSGGLRWGGDYYAAAGPEHYWESAETDVPADCDDPGRIARAIADRARRPVDAPPADETTGE